jgi:hypothetical protein
MLHNCILQTNTLTDEILVKIHSEVPIHEQAKQGTIDKVCGIVKKQLAVAEDTPVNGETKFADLGADSLDTVMSSTRE